MGFELNRLTILLFIISIIILLLSAFLYIRSSEKIKLSGNTAALFCKEDSSAVKPKCPADEIVQEDFSLYKEIDGTIYGFRNIAGDMVFGVMQDDGFKANPDLHPLGNFIENNVLDFWVDLENTQVYLLSSVSPKFKSSPIVLTRVNFDKVEYEFLDEDAKTRDQITIADKWDLITSFDDNEFALDTIVDFVNDEKFVVEGYMADGCNLTGKMYTIDVEGNTTEMIVYGDGCNENSRKLAYRDSLLYVADTAECEEGYGFEDNPYCLTNIYTLNPADLSQNVLYEFETLQYTPSDIEIDQNINGFGFQRCGLDSQCVHAIYNLDTNEFVEEELTDETLEEVVIINSPDLSVGVSSPILVTGLIDNSWLSEGTASIDLLDNTGQLITKAVLEESIPGSWLNEGMVEFQSLVEFETSSSEGTLVVIKSNLSGLPENGASFEVPIIFKN